MFSAHERLRCFARGQRAVLVETGDYLQRTTRRGSVRLAAVHRHEELQEAQEATVQRHLRRYPIAGELPTDVHRIEIRSLLGLSRWLHGMGLPHLLSPDPAHHDRPTLHLAPNPVHRSHSSRGRARPRDLPAEDGLDLLGRQVPVHSRRRREAQLDQSEELRDFRLLQFLRR